MIKICKRFTFEAAHYLPEYEGPCVRVHGHSYKLDVTIGANKINPDTGMVIDFKYLKELVNTLIINRLDHYLLNGLKWAPFKENPTAEYMVIWMVDVIQKHLQNVFGESEPDFWLHSLRLWETETCYVEWEFTPWYELTKRAIDDANKGKYIHLPIIFPEGKGSR